MRWRIETDGHGQPSLAPWVSQLQPSVLSRVRDCSTERLNASTSFETFDSAEGGKIARS